MSSFSAFPSSWEIKDLRDVPISIIDGDRGRNYPSKEEFSPEGFCLFLNTGNIQNDTFDFTNGDFITESKDALLRKGRLLRNDIVLTTRGTVGSIGYFHRGIQYDHIRINSGMVILRCSSTLSPHYFYQLFKSQTLKTQFELYSSGSAQPQLPIKDLRRVKLPIPKRATQRKIAAILSAYDELIENIKRRIALLYKLAEEIYREWFTRLRFPGHEQIKVMKGVPVGWSFDKASTFFGLVKGKSYAGDEITEEPEHMPFISLKSFNRGGGYREGGLKYYSGRYRDDQVVRQNDVVVAITDMTQDRAVVGRAARIPNLGERGAVISLDAVKLVPHNIDNTFLYAYMRHSGFADCRPCGED
jgi:type I restriction enzyme S subunit